MSVSLSVTSGSGTFDTGRRRVPLDLIRGRAPIVGRGSAETIGQGVVDGERDFARPGVARLRPADGSVIDEPACPADDQVDVVDVHVLRRRIGAAGGPGMGRNLHAEVRVGDVVVRPGAPEVATSGTGRGGSSRRSLNIVVARAAQRIAHLVGGDRGSGRVVGAAVVRQADVEHVVVVIVRHAAADDDGEADVSCGGGHDRLEPEVASDDGLSEVTQGADVAGSSGVGDRVVGCVAGAAGGTPIPAAFLARLSRRTR